MIIGRRTILKSSAAFGLIFSFPFRSKLKKKAEKSPLCKCSRGYDTDGDGDCPACARRALRELRDSQGLNGLDPIQISWNPKCVHLPKP